MDALLLAAVKLALAEAADAVYNSERGDEETAVRALSPALIVDRAKEGRRG